jgi:2-polyprenyl-3-methyl-5-hydroxy-6-metoxy-1,4-benzoquinol methylase
MQVPFGIFTDKKLADLSPYHENNAYVRTAKERMDITFALISEFVPNAAVLDVGASPFYLLDRVLAAGAAEAEGIYFSSDDHPFRDLSRVYSINGEIGIHHVDVEKENFPFLDSSFDLVTACEILEHLELFPFNFCIEVVRVLRPGGILTITVPNVNRISNIKNLLVGRNIYMKFRSDPHGRHRHEFTRSQLVALIKYMNLEMVEVGYIAANSQKAGWKSFAYKLMTQVPLVRRYSPVLYVIARQPNGSLSRELGEPPATLYTGFPAIEDSMD